LIRGKRVGDALGVLEFNPRRASKLIAKTLKSAIANAESVHNVDVDMLYVKAAWVDGAQTQKRFLPRAHGRATRIIKRSSHVTIVVDERKG
jgi:large subunit ribosomal protein L22